MNEEYGSEKERKQKAEEWLQRVKNRRKRRRAEILGVMTATLVLLTAIVFGGWKLFQALKSAFGTEEASTYTVETESLEDSEVISSNVIYSQSEMEQMMNEAIQKAKMEQETLVLEELKDAFATGKTTVEILRPFYPNDIVVASSGKINFVPINRSLKLNSYEQANLNILENGEYQYSVGEQIISHKGIDVSSHQGKIDWQQVAEDGVEFAFIRIGFRGYGKEGKLVEDEQFETNIVGAKTAGIKVGVYFFSQAINDEELLEEANMVLEKIAPYQLDCPVAYDVERVSGSNARMNSISAEERTRLSLLFCETIEKAGYQPMLYHNTEMGALMIDIAAFEKYEKWFASYNSAMFYPYEYRIWQYSEKGKVKGIKGDVDMNISFGPVWSK